MYWVIRIEPNQPDDKKVIYIADFCLKENAVRNARHLQKTKGNSLTEHNNQILFRVIRIN